MRAARVRSRQSRSPSNARASAPSPCRAAASGCAAARLRPSPRAPAPGRSHELRRGAQGACLGRSCGACAHRCAPRRQRRRRAQPAARAACASRPLQAALLSNRLRAAPSRGPQALGNTAFSAGRFQDAVGHFTDAIALDGSNHVLFSNRSAAQVCQGLSGRLAAAFAPRAGPRGALRGARGADAACSRQAALSKFSEALADAQKARRAGRRRSRRALAARLLTRAPLAAQTVELKPDWAKGYSRLGAALHGLRDYDEASATARPSLARPAHACAHRRRSPPTRRAWRSTPPTSSSSPAWLTPRRRRRVRSLVARRARSSADSLGWRRLARRAAPTASATCSRRRTRWPRSWATR